MAPSFAPLAPEDPREIGGYPLLARLGAGGMGRVYLSITQGGHALAIKIILPEHAQDEEFRRRFEREVAAAQRVQNLYTAQVVNADTKAPLPWMAAAYVPGPSLRQAVADHGPLPLPTVFRLVAGVAEGLAAVHACGIIHRDLKPANVLLAPDGPRVIDFGIAHAAAATSLTRTGQRIGTPAFMAPEQVRGRSATPATDVFALGNLAVFAVSGRSAFGEGNADALLYRIRNEPPDLDDCPDQLRAIVARCLAKNPAERPDLTEVMDYARRQTRGHIFAGSWLPTAIATSLDTYYTALSRLTLTQVPPRPRRTPRPVESLVIGAVVVAACVVLVTAAAIVVNAIDRRNLAAPPSSPAGTNAPTRTTPAQTPASPRTTRTQRPSRSPTKTKAPLTQPAVKAQAAVIYPCYAKPVAKPKDFTLYCGDGGTWLANLTWKNWGMPTAGATGQLGQHTCRPDCASGGSDVYPASVTVTGLTDGHYTDMRVVAPQASQSPMHFTLDKDGPVEAR
jgi:serine/threonine protein kinase